MSAFLFIKSKRVLAERRQFVMDVRTAFHADGRAIAQRLDEWEQELT